MRRIRFISFRWGGKTDALYDIAYPRLDYRNRTLKSSPFSSIIILHIVTTPPRRCHFQTISLKLRSRYIDVYVQRPTRLILICADVLSLVKFQPYEPAPRGCTPRPKPRILCPHAGYEALHDMRCKHEALAAPGSGPPSNYCLH